MRDIFRTLQDGAMALREMGLESAADSMLESMESAIHLCEDLLNSTYRYLLSEAESAIEMRRRQKEERVEPRRAVLRLDESLLTFSSSVVWERNTPDIPVEGKPWYGDGFIEPTHSDAEVHSIFAARTKRALNESVQ